ncbi:hypothetical protein Ccar_17380 [Clostridium carboxidivorans P7]|uniref:Putative Se/S carrier protein-like domain-containing protein n=1 Tax=Clostridium carboxidivorans P7 TaxID=536227 RepID=C6PW16_9CLOT|nr:DUF3343 domain-containing protein [Clostridium carboxidivorans]AKN32535.1 hypothetical protein Ccar_17380 [Clostridium carboxidivorans P7]EET86563.1 conserved hypothetical protein [Clostridium carboxidivorans P7]EFG87737.1 hypothetical protein CLCAR_2588 [Clostridium carboxidivorans P7]
MKKSSGEYLMVFPCYSKAMLIYNKLMEKGCKVNFISTPCEITLGCSYSIRFNEENFEIVKSELKINNIKAKSVYKIVLQDNKEAYQLIKG